MNNKWRDSDNCCDTTVPNLIATKLYDLADKIRDEIHQTTAQAEGTIISKKLQETIHANLTDAIESCEKVLLDSVVEIKKKVVGDFLHNLGKEQPSVDNVKKVIDAFPEALLYKNDRGYIPIQVVGCSFSGAKFIPLLAFETYQRKMGLERGGLLLPSSRCPTLNRLQSSVGLFNQELPKFCDEQRLQTLKDLRSAGLLLDQDITQFNLLRYTSHEYASRRLNYLLDLYPKALSIPLPDTRNFPIHPSNYLYQTKDQSLMFTKLLTVGMDHYPQHFGFLFKQNGQGERAITQAINIFGKDETLDIINKIIPSTTDYPILHHVYSYTPELCDDFLGRYPDTVHFKDRRGRHLLHVAVNNDLNVIYKLLGRHPGLISDHFY